MKQLSGSSQEPTALAPLIDTVLESRPAQLPPTQSDDRFASTPSHVVSTPSYGLCLLDAPNIRCAVYDILGRHARGDEVLDLGRLRSFLMDRYEITRFIYVVRGFPFHARVALRDWVRARHWTYLETSRSRYGADENDPVDDYIRNRIHSMTAESDRRQRIVCLVSHDGGYAEVLARFIEETPGRVLLAGFVERFSRRLRKLAVGGRAEFIDLQFTCGAIVLPQRARFRRLARKLQSRSTSRSCTTYVRITAKVGSSVPANASTTLTAARTCIGLDEEGNNSAQTMSKSVPVVR